jgi:hypothetical protein
MNEAAPASAFYADCHRALQDRHDTRRLADRLAEVIVHDQFSEEDRGFIESRDMFFLSTVDPDGHPTVSYKGGAAGFVRVEGNALIFPCYDGNGMFLSAGNIAATSKVGLLFIDFETPHRLRVQGFASLDDRPTKPGEALCIRVQPSRIFVNCSRYIHKHKKLETSKYVPAPDGSAPIAEWKRIDFIQDALPARDQASVAAAGPISIADYGAKVARGEA